MLRRLNEWLIDRRFKRLVRPFDQRIEAARKAHASVRAIQAEKTAFVHGLLERGA